MVGFRITLCVTLLLACALISQAQQIHRNGFEQKNTVWIKGATDAVFDAVDHKISNESHDGQRSEFIQVNFKQGTYLHYQYSTQRALVSEELTANLWIKGNRPGMQIIARVVLPNERDPKNLDTFLTTTIRGDSYRDVGRWQRLDLGRPRSALKQQQQLMQANEKRPLNFTGAYIDALLLNVFGGPGPTEVWIDDLEIGPIEPDSPFQPVRPANPNEKVIGTPTNIVQPSGRSAMVELNGSRLVANGKPFFPRIVRLTDTPVETLHKAGFNTILVDQSTSPDALKKARELGMYIVPQINGTASNKEVEEIIKEIGRFPQDDVLFWHVGRTLASEQAPLVARTAQAIRSADPGRLLGAEVWDGMMPYSRNLNLVGVHRWPLMTTLELPKYQEWLDLRRRLANPNVYMWTWIQTHIPEWQSQLFYEQSSQAAFKDPAGPQPEQIRLLTYTALASGAKGIGFYSDRWLADSHQGRDRLLGCALLNQELEILEPLLLTVEDPPQWVRTSSPDVRAAIFRTAKGILVIPIWQGKGAQYVPGQAAVSKLTVIVPQVPQSTQCWEVLPGDVRSLKVERVVGGTQLTLRDFGLTSAIVFTPDTDLIARFQTISRNRRQLAAQWTFDMAIYELEKVLKIENELEKMGITLPDGAALVEDARNRLKASKQFWDNRQFSESYRESQRALRPVRIMMRAQWENAVAGYDSPVSSPYALSFYTLPKHYQFASRIKGAAASNNSLPGGDFENLAASGPNAWKLDETTLDDVELTASPVSEFAQPMAKNESGVPSALDYPKQGKMCAMLQVRPKKGKPAPLALERTLVALTSPAVRLEPGSLVQVSGWVRIPTAIEASPDGALLYDSAGGEPLALRLTEATPWKKITVYRRVPASGNMQVTLALTGIGSVYFDDIRIESLGNAPANTASIGPAMP